MSAASYDRDHAVETYKSLITVSVEGFKTLLLINGGAVVALLAFLSQSAQAPTLARELLLAVSFFILGIVSGAVAFAAAYKTQYALLNEHFPERRYKGWRHQTWLRVAFTLALVSVVSFAAGAVAAVLAFASLQTPASPVSQLQPPTVGATASASSPSPPASK